MPSIAPAPPSSTAVQLGTLGMFILDTFSFLDPVTAEPQGDRGLGIQLGGGGLYFCIGARTALDPAAIQMIIDTGTDFHPDIRAALERFDRTAPGHSPMVLAAGREGRPPSMWHFRQRDGQTTRAVNVYRGEHRGFEYLTPKVRLEVRDLVLASPTTPPTLPRWIHMICTPQRARDIIQHIDANLAAATAADLAQTKSLGPRLVYEPIPDSCVPENLDDCLGLLDRLAVFSPNHEEAAALLGLSEAWQTISTTDRSAEVQVEWIKRNLAHGFVERCRAAGVAGNLPLICIRSGKLGCVIGSDAVGFQHVPAYHTADVEPSHPASSTRVVDVTGAGNAFLGGLTASLVVAAAAADDARPLRAGQKQEARHLHREAAIHGAVAASLVIEQLGLPSFDVVKEPAAAARATGQQAVETWNGATIHSRIEHLRQRVAEQGAA
ncbi:uncharacterized protein PFL1_06505 [Pseudozyma flocculosa PF-1]|uniref:Related to MAK32 protein n=2 Tax=Pseudozyma flocculosa TaxID=84751 RepID=A0A5C3F8H0_9BASI|nr:uncharacterized protein PFL1_06505 [Pseudozyma flocculosa PF-1]EPQ25830.1 hypothetical protein PFL1_06505 [Pseudozyma flocculosa PF-1]SPO40672.1 related to MAK32 protein [Pseudozyma flocculosa]